ncbi:ABC transporter ATP-binding protein [Burkholderia cepacia]|uniref:ABC transporter ATP-binding protein n=1 Tax=Burkholderia cepacia TaxID=292 RepID=UPI000756F47B|nr:ABC transporter ATP-binding protein [Burkholderia cepacia]OUE44194.1 ATP-binding protein [Burkholderia territorii]EMD9437586.1 ABC transporter ATP-binding protein [Burkholderia cepacia]KWC77584.1 ATP-binding protein [Burkholderia cepacia]KWF85237.1 ATP-binding protein [Burkholderia cepacia]KWH54003.1 ATP-binding protein [Burkholderia cepacia]
MISLDNVNKFYQTRSGRRQVLKDISFSIARGERIGILGKNGAGKSTLIRMISGTDLPTSGVIDRRMSVSWPLAFSGGFQGSLTGFDNARFICRVYDADMKQVLPFVEEFADLGAYMKEPVKKYSSGMLARLAFALSMAIEFDCFLIDEVIAVGDRDFQIRCHRELFEKRSDRAMIIVSHDAHMIREHCNRASVLRDGVLHHFSSIDSAYDFYENN